MNYRLATAGLAAALLAFAQGAFAADSAATIARGKYLAVVAGCNDCHTPGFFLGHPDAARYLGGSDVGFAIPGLGVFVGRNLTPDKDTGLGGWTRAQIITAFTTGKRPDGRQLAPIMPYDSYKSLSKADANAVAAYLQSLKPVNHAVAGPFGPKDKVTVFVMDVLPADIFNSLPPPGPPPAGK
jgi:mono/diheme cytochrome c family protein